jgi:tRNA modification GTPase
MWHPDDLIVAQATIPGRGVRAIVRMSGAALDELLESLFLFADPLPAAPRSLPATLRPDRLGSEWGLLPLDILRWPGPAGPTGGPLAEVQLPCSQPLVEALIVEACRCGARLARAGEFTLRAFLAGKLDLLQAEAVLAVVDARGPGELSAALDRLAGGTGRDLHAVRERLLDLTADVEAAIDFADERSPDTLGTTAVAFWRDALDAVEALARAVDEVAAKVESRDGGARGRLPRVVITGPPNIGKSSLYNALVGREAALVADEAGTTRDWLETAVTGALGPLPGHQGEVSWLLVDTAGVEGGNPAGVVQGDAAGDAAALAAAAGAAGGVEVGRADVVLRCRDATASVEGNGPTPVGATILDVITRCDRGVEAPLVDAGIATSVLTGAGIDRLRREVTAAVAARAWRGGGAERLRAGLVGAATALARARAIAASGVAGGPAEEPLLAENLLQAIDSIGEVTGHTIGTDLLDRIFSRHCVGK